jgi:hypothetical protein
VTISDIQAIDVHAHYGLYDQGPDLIRHCMSGDAQRVVELARLAHIGCTIDEDPGHQVHAMQQSKHGNVFADTSSAQSIVNGLIEWAVAEVGSERILYGTDTPLYSAPMQRSRIDRAEISDADKQCILRDNAMKLFQFSEVEVPAATV